MCRIVLLHALEMPHAQGSVQMPRICMHSNGSSDACEVPQARHSLWLGIFPRSLMRRSISQVVLDSVRGF